jgi:hypothetical protein
VLVGRYWPSYVGQRVGYDGDDWWSVRAISYPIRGKHKEVIFSSDLYILP